MKILHLSDLHIGNKLTFLDAKVETHSIVQDIVAKWVNDTEKPFILITGDIVNDGSEGQFRDARDVLWGLKEMGFETMIIPGNHDYGIIGNYAEEDNFEFFKQYFNEFYPENEVKFPDVRSFENVTIIGLNSMQGEIEDKKVMWANGQLGGSQLITLKKILKYIRDEQGPDHKIVLALHHHPFDLKQCDSPIHCLKDGPALMGTICLERYKVDVLLFGHEHDEFTAYNLYGIPLVHMNDKSTKCKGGFSGREPQHPASIITINYNENPSVEPVIWAV